MSLVVVRALGLVTIQDLGRPGRMHEALPPGGALVRSALARANRNAGNADGAAAIEVCGVLVVRAEQALHVATDREWRVLQAGDEMTIASDQRRVAYLAVRGGIAAPVILGGRGAHLSAGIGALLRPGDRLTAGDDTGPISVGSIALADHVELVPGPDLDAFAPDALALLAGAAWKIGASSDRVGTRLEGPAVPRRAGYRDASRPIVIGAIEIPPDGAPIVLGPEHPTTGGYPVLAVVATRSLDALHAIRLGGTVRFRLG